MDGGDDRFDVRPVAVRSSGAQRRVVAGAAVVLILAVVATAPLLGRGDGRTASQPEPSRSAGQAATPTIVPSRSAGVTTPSAGSSPQRSATTTPVAGNIPLPGSPEIVMFQRTGDDIDVLAWRAGEPDFAATHRVRDGMRGFTETQTSHASLSPDGSVLLVHAQPATHGEQDTLRLFRLDGSAGHEIWQSDTLGTNLTSGFAPTGQLIIMAPGLLSRDRGWTIVDVAADAPAVHEIAMPPFPEPVPSASAGFGTLVVNYQPWAFSADGQWLYAMSVHATEPQYRPAYRISMATGEPEGLDVFPHTGPSRVVSPSVDAITGRLLLAGPYTTSGPGLVQAWSAGATTPDFQVELGTVFFAAWGDDGSVITADYDKVPGPFTFRVLSISAAGELTRTYLTAEGTDAGLFGIADGFAGAYVASAGTNRRDLVLIRLSDGATSRQEVAEPNGLMRPVLLRR